MRATASASAAVMVRIWTASVTVDGRSTRAAGARMGLVVDREQGGGVDLGVALRGRQRGVAQQFLDRPQIAAAGEQMGGEAMAQRVRRGRIRQAQARPQMLQAKLHQPRIEAGAAGATE